MLRRRTKCLGLDVGGANLKAATARGTAKQIAFPLWSQPDELSGAVARLLAIAPPHDALAVTMTGELADCFETKQEGVIKIVEAVERAAGGKKTAYYTLNGCFVEADEARQNWKHVAAANWHALALALSKRFDSDKKSILIDVGSTTTDIIPFTAKHGADDALVDDTDRLLLGQLLYQGVGRTPVCAVVDRLPYRGQSCPVSAELFATTADVSLLLGHASESADVDTADNRPFNRANATMRLGRMLCADATRFNQHDAEEAARHVREEMEIRLADAITKIVDRSEFPTGRFVIGGSGDWLAKRALASLGFLNQTTYLADKIGHQASRCAPAWAVASLAEGEPGG